MEDTCERNIKLVPVGVYPPRVREATFPSMKRECYGWRWFPDPEPHRQPRMMNREEAASAIAAVPTQGHSDPGSQQVQGGRARPPPP